MSNRDVWCRCAAIAALSCLLWAGGISPPSDATADPLLCSVQGVVGDVLEPFPSRLIDGAFLVLESEPPGLYGAVAVTDPLGEYQFLAVPPGMYTLSIHTSVVANGIITYDEYRLDGVTFPFSQFPASSVTVEVPKTDPFEVFEPGMPRTVDVNGFPSTQGSDNPSVKYPAFPVGPDSVSGYVVRPIGVLNATLAQINPQPVFGGPIIRSEPVPGVTVRLTGGAGDATYPRTDASDAEGKYEIDASTGVPDELSVDLGGGTFGLTEGPPPPDFHIFILPGRLGGFQGRAFVEFDSPNLVFDGTDQPLGGLTVRVFDPFDLSTPAATTTTAADGTYAFPPEYEDGAYLLDVVDPSRSNAQRAGALRLAESDPVDFAFTLDDCPDFEDPVVTCPADVTLECMDPDGEVVDFAATATDDCTPSDQLVISYAPQGPGSTFLLGTTTVTATATDLAGRTGQCSFDVTVADTTPPVITLTGPSVVTLECGVDDYVEQGATATDVCDGDLPPVTIDSSAVDTHAGGTYLVTYDVRDASGNDAATVTRTVIVRDTTPPVLTVAVARTVLWPPSGGLPPVGLTAVAVDACDGPVPVVLIVYSNEPHGTAPLTPDATGDTPATLRLRAQRAYPGPGRFYLVRVDATDAAGNRSVACGSTLVPVYPTSMHMLALRAAAMSFEAACLAAAPGGDVAGLQTLLAPPPQPQ